ncbi:amino acid permease [Mycoplasmatota bacterium]|nr:amino acid permease [Mycoplasmatota bacterium]
MKKQDKGLTVFSLTMMALGTVIGGSFFLGSGISIYNSGPGVILAYILGGLLVAFILFALSEMTVADPNSGSFRAFAEHAFGKGMGFTIGWVYWTGLVLAMSSEAVAVSTFIRLWFPNLSIPLLGTIVIVFITLINLLGTNKLSLLENGLASIKLLTIVGFIVIATYLIFGLGKDVSPVGLGALKNEALFPYGFKGIAGSMLIIIFTYAGFEIIGLAASETPNPHHVIPKTIVFTVITLVGLYTISTLTLLPLISTNKLSTEESPFVLALNNHNIFWAGKVMNLIMVTAIFSTMLAATFGLARMLRSLADEGYAFKFLKDQGDIPYRGIIFSGLAMLFAFSMSFVLPSKIYVFLVSSGGFAFLFTYLIIVSSHLKFRKKNGCPPKGKCQLPLYPYSSWISIIMLIIIIISMPFVKGQALGLIAGIGLLLFYFIIYLILRKKLN